MGKENVMEVPQFLEAYAKTIMIVAFSSCLFLSPLPSGARIYLKAML